MAAIRRIRPEEWRELRDVRLRALATDPDAFGSTLERERAYEDETWQEWAREDAEGDTDATFLAWNGSEPVGMAAGVSRPETPGVTVLAMWVAPDVRRDGTGRALLDAVEAWAFGLGAGATNLSVTDVNPEAQRFYERCGYAATSHTKTLPRDPSLTEISMRKPRPG